MELDSALYIEILKEEIKRLNEERLLLLAMVQQLQSKESDSSG